MKTITTCPGIGDVLFIFQKLINQPERIRWQIWDGMRNGVQAQPRRGKQVFDLFPQLTEHFSYIPDAGYRRLKRNAYSGSWATAPDDFILEANSHLEAGRRIELFLPDLPTSFILPFATKREHKAIAEHLLPNSEDTTWKLLPFQKEGGTTKYTVIPDEGDIKYIGIYTTSYNNSKYMSGWLIDQWHQFIVLLQNHDPSYKFVFIGAHYDRGISQEVMNLMDKGSYINTIGEDENSDTLLPVVVELLKRLHIFVGFQSGLCIINELIGARQTVMLYSHALEEMIDTWPDLARIADGSYKGCTFGTEKHPLTPHQLFNWLKENNKL